ncbi:hypothetical protein [Nonomuraea sp. NPDC002799]
MSAIVLALGLAGVGATPFIVQSASASVAAYDPPVEPCDVGEVCDATPETTVTVTTTLDTPTPEETPETTITKTVTASPSTKSKSPTPAKSTTAPASSPASAPAENPQPLTSQSIEVPPTSAAPTVEPSVEMPAIAPSDTATPPPAASETPAASTEEIPVELRGAAPEFDQRTLTQKLSIPALVLVLLALFAVLIFEGRLRRMAHAAAVRKAGPPMGHPEGPPGGGYPAGPGYATAGFTAPGYPGGTAYAPIISFVPVQTYPSGQVQYGAVYQDPNHPYPPQGYTQEPPAAEPMVLHPDEFDSFSHEPPRTKEFRDPFEPLVAPEPVPADIPPGGASPYEDDAPERPLGATSFAESGDAEPWQGEAGGLFQPARPYEPPPYLAPDEDVTAVQPLPPQPQEEEAQPEPTKEMPDSKRKRFRRAK